MARATVDAKEYRKDSESSSNPMDEAWNTINEDIQGVMVMRESERRVVKTRDVT